MRCPQCGSETPDDGWNCVSCRINLYWANQHHRELAQIRERQGLNATTATPAFLIKAHRTVMDDRADKGGSEEQRVRQVARRLMRGHP